MDLTWKDIADFEDLYEVSENGDVRNKTTMKVKSICNWGDRYNVVSLYRNGKCTTRHIHRVVAEAFIENNIDGFNCVNHIDGNKLNNHYTNLEWTNHSGNLDHAWDSKLRGNETKLSGSVKSLNMRSRFAIKKLNDIGVDVTTLAQSFNVDEKVIIVIIRAFSKSDLQSS